MILKKYRTKKLLRQKNYSLHLYKYLVSLDQLISFNFAARFRPNVRLKNKYLKHTTHLYRFQDANGAREKKQKINNTTIQKI